MKVVFILTWNPNQGIEISYHIWEIGISEPIYSWWGQWARHLYFLRNGLIQNMYTSSSGPSILPILLHTFKGIVSRDKYLFKGPKNSKQYFLNERLCFSQFSDVFLWRKSKMKFLLHSMKSLTNCEIHSRNPLQRACSGFLIAACAFKSCYVILKIVRKPAMNVH
jgi:hypothetical protein